MYFRYLDKKTKLNLTIFILPSILLGLFYFMILASEDEYWKKDNSNHFVNFYETSINGKLDYKSRVRSGDFISVENSNEHFRLRKVINDKGENFIDYAFIGDMIKKDSYSRNICIVKEEKEKCFKYILE